MMQCSSTGPWPVWKWFSTHRLWRGR